LKFNGMTMYYKQGVKTILPEEKPEKGDGLILLF
jgi:hypothetical protein